MGNMVFVSRGLWKAVGCSRKLNTNKNYLQGKQHF